jgi:hypothetical protein
MPLLANHINHFTWDSLASGNEWGPWTGPAVNAHPWRTQRQTDNVTRAEYIEHFGTFQHPPSLVEEDEFIGINDQALKVMDEIAGAYAYMGARLQTIGNQALVTIRQTASGPVAVSDEERAHQCDRYMQEVERLKDMLSLASISISSTGEAIWRSDLPDIGNAEFPTPDA